MWVEEVIKAFVEVFVTNVWIDMVIDTLSGLYVSGIGVKVLTGVNENDLQAVVTAS